MNLQNKTTITPDKITPLESPLILDHPPSKISGMLANWCNEEIIKEAFNKNEPVRHKIGQIQLR